MKMVMTEEEMYYTAVNFGPGRLVFPYLYRLRISEHCELICRFRPTAQCDNHFTDPSWFKIDVERVIRWWREYNSILDWRRSVEEEQVAKHNLNWFDLPRGIVPSTSSGLIDFNIVEQPWDRDLLPNINLRAALDDMTVLKTSNAEFLRKVAVYVIEESHFQK